MTREEFLKRRKSGIGGSDVAAVLGLSKWRSPLDVWREKVSTEAPEDKPNDVLRLASYLEEYAAQRYEEITGRMVRRRNSELVSAAYPFLKGNIDREVLHDERGLGFIEIKALSTYNYRRVEMNGLGDDYLLQTQHYYYCGNGKYKWWDHMILNRDNGQSMIIPGTPNLDWYANEVVPRLVEFWQKCVETCTPPVGNAPDAPMPKLPATDGKIADMNGDTELAALLGEYREWRRICDDSAVVLDGIKEKIAAKLGSADVAECAGARMYYKSSIRNTFDTATFRKENPEIFFKYYKKTETAKSLRIYETTNQER